MSTGLGDYLNSINKTKENLFDGESPDAAERFYPPFIINRCLAAHLDCILLVNELNVRGGPEFGLTKRGHYEFLLNSISKSNRFAKLPKYERDERVELVKKLNNVSIEKACDLASILTDQQFEELKKLFEEGGSSRAK